MVTREEPIFKGKAGDRVNWQQIKGLLSLGQYEQVAILLHQAQIASQRTDDVGLSNMLAAACQICLFCRQCQDSSAWHQKLQEQVSHRELELKQQLQTMLDLVSNWEWTEIHEVTRLRSTAPIAELRLPPRDKPKVGEGFSLWRWAQKLLSRKPEPNFSLVEPLQESSKTLLKSPQDTGELPLGFSGKAAIPATSSPDENVMSASPLARETKAEVDDSPSQKAEAPDVSSNKVPGFPGDEAEISTPPSAKKFDEPSIPPKEEVETPTAGPVVEEKQEAPDMPTLIIYCLGPFRVYQDDQPVNDWSSSKGKVVFKYLVTHRERPVPKEVLMDLFWAAADPDAARNNLNVAIYGLRQTLHKTRKDFSHVLFQEDHYLLNPELHIWLDVEAFMEHLKMAKSLEQRREMALAVREYRAAEALYQGEFLAEDRYEEWVFPLRQRLQDDYMHLLDRLSLYYLDQEAYDACVTMCDKILVIEPGREEAHLRLMHCYHQQGQRYLALRQYHLCMEALARELDVDPSQPTIELYKRIRQR